MHMLGPALKGCLQDVEFSRIVKSLDLSCTLKDISSMENYAACQSRSFSKR